MRTRGLHVFEIDGSEVPDKRSFLEGFASQMRFPNYFGFNWDAFNDSATDMSWFGASMSPGIVVLYTRFKRFLEADFQQFSVGLDCLNSIVDRWWHRGVPYYVLLMEKGETRIDSCVPLIQAPWSLDFLHQTG